LLISVPVILSNLTQTREDLFHQGKGIDKSKKKTIIVVAVKKRS